MQNQWWELVTSVLLIVLASIMTSSFSKMFIGTVYDLPSTFFDNLADYVRHTDDDFLIEEDGYFVKKFYDTLDMLNIAEEWD